MEYIEYAFPELEDVEGMTRSEQGTLIQELSTMHDYQKQVTEILLEQKVLQALEMYQPDIHQVIVHPACVKEEEGYQFKNAMVWVNDWEDPSNQRNSKSRFQAGLDESLKDLAPMMKDIIDFNVPQLVAKYRKISQDNIQEQMQPEPAKPSFDFNKPDFSQQDGVKPKVKYNL